MHTGPKQSKEIERRLCGRETEEADDQVGRRQSAGRGRHIKCGARLYCVHNPGNTNVLQLNPPIAGSLTVINQTLNPLATIANPVPRELYLKQAVFNVVSIAPDRKHDNA
jgi:hypothetical protein